MAIKATRTLWPLYRRIWNEISMDYITDIPLTATGSRHLLVITDELEKDWCIPCRDLKAGSLAKLFCSITTPAAMTTVSHHTSD